MKHISRNVFIVLLLLSAFAALFANAALPFFYTDEQIFAETAKEMLQFRDYLVPRLHNEYLLNMPPLYYWILAGSVSAFGDNLFAMRFPAAIMGILTVMMVYVASTKLWNERIGFWAGLILSSNMLFFYSGKASAADTTCSFFVTGTLLCFLCEKYWLQYVFGGMAVLAMGFSGLLFPTGILLIYLLMSGQMHRVLRMHVLPGLVLSCVFFIPWYYLAYETYGMEFCKAVFSYESLFCIGRIGEAPQNFFLWRYPFLIILAGIFPWTGLLMKSIKDGICESRTIDLQRNTFLNLWWLLAIVVFTLCSVKQSGMLIIVFPALAMLTSWNMERMIREDRNHFTSWAFSSVAAYIVAATLLIIGFWHVQELAFGSMVLGVVILILGGAVAVSLLMFKDGMLAAWLHVATAFMILIIVSTFLLPVAADILM